MSAHTNNADEHKFQRAVAFHASGQLGPAERLYQEIIQSRPTHFNATFYLAAAYAQQNKLDLAAQFFGRAAEINPASVDAHFNCGLALQSLRKFEEAIESYDRAIRRKPNQLDAHYNRGSALSELKHFEEALKSYDRAISIKPDFAEAYFNRGNAQHEMKRFEEALKSYEFAIRLKRDYAEAYSGRGNTLHALQRFEEALAICDLAIQLKPGQAEAHYNRGVMLSALNRFEDALKSYDRAIQIEPAYADAYSNRGATLLWLKRFEEALLSFDRAIQLKPESEFLSGTALHTRMWICDWRNYNADSAELFDRILHDEKVTVPFPLLALPSSHALQRKAAEIWTGSNRGASGRLEPAPKLPAHQRIRVGYFSADFRNHPVALSIVELIERHDRTMFELIGFSFGPDTSDDIRQRLKVAFDKFIDVRNTPDLDVAVLSRNLEIDIGIDLNGFTQGSRTDIFAMRAAPIQVSYLGYPGTMPADYIDYLVADSTVIVASREQYYTEKIVYLPNSFFPNDRKRQMSDKAFMRSEHGLPPEAVVFCCFNNNYKITPDVFDSWMRILTHVEESILWLRKDNQTAVRSLRNEARVRGVDPDRLIFAPRVAYSDHLSRHRMADLFLDTLPYNAHTTASDALWTGLPVLTRIGETFAGRVAASLLNAIHVPELITSTLEEYEALAIELGTDPAKLASIKHKLADKRLTTPLFDTELLARHIEAGYTKMYERYRAGLAPEHMYVPQ